MGDVSRELSKLVEHPAWEVLRSQFEIRKQNYLAGLARRLAAGGEDAEPINQRQLDYRRGFLKGAQAVLDTPDNALKLLEDALRKESSG